MAENTEIDDRVDLDDENYSEEEEDADAELVEDEGAGEVGDENGEEQSYDSGGGDSGREQSPEADMGDVSEPAADEEKPSASLSEEEQKEHAELLALPPHGSEVFIGGIPRDVSEEDLRDLCEPLGEIHEVRVMRNRDTGESKGFAFVAFKTKDEAQKTIEELHNKEYKGKTLRCSLSETKYRLFIGNVPKSWSDDDFRKVIDGTGPGAELIELIKVCIDVLNTYINSCSSIIGISRRIINF